MKNSRLRKQTGFTLIEVMVALVILVIGVLSLVSVLTQGLKASYQTQIQYIAQQKAQEAMETIFTARDTRLVTARKSTTYRRAASSWTLRSGCAPQAQTVCSELRTMTARTLTAS